MGSLATKTMLSVNKMIDGMTLSLKRYAGGKVQDSDQSRATEYYKDVDPEILRGLYKKYYWDFKIFGYSPAYVGHPELDDGIH